MIRENQTGYTLVEFMLALVLSAIVAIISSNVYLEQHRVVRTSSDLASTRQQTVIAFDQISELLRHAHSESIQLSCCADPLSTTEQSIESLNVVFTIPQGYSIWPNIVAPYANNFIRISWTNNPDHSSANAILYGAAGSLDGINNASLNVMVGGNQGRKIRIKTFDIWPLQSNGLNRQPSNTDSADGGYQIVMVGRSPYPDMSYENPNTTDNDELHYRRFVAQGVVVPRN
ncbi:MAG: prepilin-type N-terminal cleavage/methylation domain-containing protein [Gammaproteobacteria bacterium]|nr:prepilin-type N-terminal cleavage/methylation domain-containing protein [Gammaproteobacteria bacterium]MDH5730914.1 prepilin-type N-terminal cleavage/methylation domain-containing protein [Gammaproteobacteria bacterium]